MNSILFDVKKFFFQKLEVKIYLKIYLTKKSTKVNHILFLFSYKTVRGSYKFSFFLPFVPTISCIFSPEIVAEIIRNVIIEKKEIKA